jgi:tetratricopeptide (TPR) repeat protein
MSGFIAASSGVPSTSTALRYQSDSRLKETAESRAFLQLDRHAEARRSRARTLDETQPEDARVSSPASSGRCPVWLVGPELAGAVERALTLACDFARLGREVHLVTRLPESDFREGASPQDNVLHIDHVRPLESYCSKLPDSLVSSAGPSVITFFLPLSARLAEKGVKHICVLPEDGATRHAVSGALEAPGEVACDLACLPDYLAGTTCQAPSSLGRRVFPATPQVLEGLMGGVTPGLPAAPHVPSVSACLIAKDEEGMIEDCLWSLVAAADETVLNDTGSEDDTARIAREFGASVFSSEWKGDFSRARNLALDRAQSDYILSIDADERLDRATAPSLKLDLVRGSEAYLVEVANESDGGVPVVISAYRMFRNSPDLRFSGRVHEQVEPRGATPRCAVRIQHLGYLKDVSSARGKRRRNMALLQASVADEDLGPVRKLYYRYQTGVELMASGDYPGALRILKEVRREAPRSAYFAPHVAWHLCEAYIRCGRFDEALRSAKDGLEAYPGFAALAEVTAWALSDQGRFAEAGELLSRSASAASSPLPLPTIEGSDTYVLHLLMARVHAGLGDETAALSEAKASLSAKPDWGPAQAFVTRHFPGQVAEVMAALSPATVRPAALELLRMGRADEALALSSSARDTGAEGEVLLSLGKLGEAVPLLLSSADPWDRDRGACLVLLGAAGQVAAAVPEARPGEALHCVLNGAPAPRGRIPQAMKLLSFLLDIRALDRFSRGLAAVSLADDPELLAGMLLYQKGFRELAAGPLEVSYRKNKGADSLAMLAVMASGRQRNAEAAGYFRELRSFRSLALDEYAAYLRSLLATGDSAAATEVLKDALFTYPQSADLKQVAARMEGLDSRKGPR